MDHIWYLASDKPTGPFSELHLKNLIKTGEISPGSLVWRSGLKTWEPAHLHFAFNSEKSCESEIAAPTIQVPPKFISPDQLLPHKSFKWFWLLFVSGIFSLWLTQNSQEWPLQIENSAAAFAIWIAPYVFLAAITIVWLLVTWRLAGTNQNRTEPSRWSGLLKLTGVICTTVVAAYLFIVGTQISEVLRVFTVRESYANYTIVPDNVNGIVRVEGTIGPGLSRKLEKIFLDYSKISTLEINSPGGLLDEALRTAEVLERHKKIKVVARSRCSSACTLIFFAGNQRFADWNLSLGFHPANAIADVGQFFKDGMRKSSIRADAYLKKRGIPERLRLFSNTAAGSNLFMEPAITLAEDGLIQGLVDGLMPVNISVAKWRAIEDGLNVSSAIPLTEVLKAVRATRPEIVRDRAANLYIALRTKNAPALTGGIALIIKEVVVGAVLAADAEPIRRYLRATLVQVQHLAEAESWLACKSYIDGNAGAVSSQLSEQALKEELTALAAMIQSAGARKWTKQTIPQWAEATELKIIETTASNLHRHGAKLNQVESGAKDKCIWVRELFSATFKEQPPRDIHLFRWLISQN